MTPRAPLRACFSSIFVAAMLLSSLPGSERASAMLATESEVPASTSTIPANVQAVTREATKSNNHPDGRPLPLATAWGTGSYAYWRTIKTDGTYLTPAFQKQLLEAGHHWLPAVKFPDNLDSTENLHSIYGEAWDTFAAWGIPFAMSSTQWESYLTNRPEFRNLPPAENPNVIGTDGLIKNMVDPLGPLTPWYDAGKLWTSEKTGWADIAARYPNPPMVIFLSNNEHAKLKESNADTSQRWVDAYGTGTSATFRREMFVKGWKDRYSELFRGMRDGLALSAPGWLLNNKMVGFGVNDLGHYGRWFGWKEYSNYYPNHIVSEHTFWEGGSPGYYLNDWESVTDFSVYSTQTQFMNLIFMNQAAHAENPEYWFEMSTWDGFMGNPADTGDPTKDKRAWYESIGQSFTPEREKAWVQYGMWLTHPRSVRMFNCGWSISLEKCGAMERLAKVIEAVDDIYNDPLKERFWRKGQLVVNDKRKHPYKGDIPPEYAHIERWYNLDTELDAEGTWSNGTEIPVWALAHVLGEAPNREWLIYAYSPKQDRPNVHVKIPGYCTVVMDVPQSGTFLHVQESTCADDTFGGSGLRLRYTFDEVGADPKRSFTDASGNGFYGEWKGSTPVALVPGKFGNAVAFNSAGDIAGERVTIHRDLRQSFDLANTLVDGGAVSFWIRMDKSQVGASSVFNPLNGGWQVYFPGGTAARLLLNINGIIKKNIGPTIPTDGQWHHVAHVLNSDRTHKYYLDGVLKGTVGPISAFPQASGDRVWNTTATIGDSLEAGLDDLRLYDYPLSAAEVQSLYQGTLDPL